MKTIFIYFTALLLSACLLGCTKNPKEITAADILGNPDYPAISYGGYRQNTRDIVPTIGEIKDDLKILSAMGVGVLRTYNTQEFAHASNLLKAIRELKEENSDFEMYVMLGAWIECQGAWTASADHSQGNESNNLAEIEAAVLLANQYDDIVKVIAVGNEAMVHWAATYFVHPPVILKWVNHLQNLKKAGKIPVDIWITSSDNFASWGGGDASYHTDDLETLIKAVDYISLHTYPFHDSHYNSDFWNVPEDEEELSDLEKIDAAMLRAKDYAISQYQAASDYIKSLGIDKPIHIGETGWASIDGSIYGDAGSKAADEYKEKLYYDYMRDWTSKAGISCFYFEAFDEKWKDQISASGSENHFGLINLNGQAKFALWDLVDKGVFDGLTRNGVPITKTYDGDIDRLLKAIKHPPLRSKKELANQK